VNAERLKVLSGGSLVLALLQNVCVAVLTVSGIRVAIGLTALAAGSVYGPVLAFHQDAIRIPMLTLAVAGALTNLAVLAWMWHLRSRPSGQWRRRELSAKERRSERIQVALALATLLLVGVETWTHVVMTHRAQAQDVRSTAFYEVSGDSSSLSMRS